jgi:hypothetical protein
MTRIAYDVSGVEGTGGEDPPPGIYEAEIVGAEQRTEKADGSPANDIHVTFDLGGDWVRKHSYIGLGESAAWKLKEFTNALGLKDKGTIDTAKLEGKKVRVKLNPDTYDGEPRSKVGTILKLKPAKGEAVEDEPEEEVEEEVEEEELDSAAPVDLDSMDRDELKAFIKDNNLRDAGVKVLKADSDDDLRDKIREAMPEEEAEAEEEEEDGEEEEAEPEDDYDQWKLAELKEEIGNRDLTVESPVTKAKAIAALRANDKEEPF